MDRCGVLPQRDHDRADFPVGSVGSDDQLENRPVPDPQCLVTMATIFLRTEEK